MKKTIIAMLLLGLIPVVSGADFWENSSHTYFDDDHDDSIVNARFTGYDTGGGTGATYNGIDEGSGSYLNTSVTDGYGGAAGTTGTYGIKLTGYYAYNNLWADIQFIESIYVATFSIIIAGDTNTTIDSFTASWRDNITVWYNETNPAASIYQNSTGNTTVNLTAATLPLTYYFHESYTEQSGLGTTSIRLHNTSLFTTDPIEVKLTLAEGTENFTIINGETSSEQNDTETAVINTLTSTRAMVQWNNQTFETHSYYVPAIETIAKVTPTNDCYITMNIYGDANSLTDAQVTLETVTGFSSYYVTEARLSDVTGQVIMPLRDNYYYRYTVSHPSYDEQTYYYVANCDLDRTINIYLSLNETYTITRLDANHQYYNDTGIITINWSDPDNNNQNVSVIVLRPTITGDAIICHTGQTGASNTTDCNITGNTGELWVQVNRTSGVDYGAWQKVQKVRVKDFIAPEQGAMWAFFILITVAGFGLFSPVGAIITTIIGLVMVYFLGIFTPLTVTFIIVAAVIGIALGVKMRQ